MVLSIFRTERAFLTCSWLGLDVWFVSIIYTYLNFATFSKIFLISEFRAVSFSPNIICTSEARMNYSLCNDALWIKTKSHSAFPPAELGLTQF
jgi:hypothetical protein